MAVARAGGAVLVGPNCLGIADTGAGLQLSHAVLPPGEVAVLSQSGNLVLDLAALLAERGLGISRFVSLGNQADLTVVDLMRCVRRPRRHPCGRDLRRGRGRRTRLRVGGPRPGAVGQAGGAALAGSVRRGRAQRGVAHRVDDQPLAGGRRRMRGRGSTPGRPSRHMADLLEGLLGPRRMPGRRVAVLTDGGGHGAVAADALTAAGLETPLLGEATRERLRGVLWASSSVTNPVDLAGAGDRDPMGYARAVERLLAGDEVDGVLMTGYFGGYSTEPGGVHDLEVAAAHAIAAAAKAQHKPVRRAHDLPDEPDGRRAPRGGDPGAPRRRPGERRAGRARGAPAAAVRRRSRRSRRRSPTRRTTRRRGCSPTPASPSRPHAPCDRSDQLDGGAVRVTGFPLVLKALGQVHKSDAGGVVLGLRDEQAALAAYDDLVRAARPAGGLGRGDGRPRPGASS